MANGREHENLGLLRRWELAFDMVVALAAAAELTREIRTGSLTALSALILVLIAVSLRRRWPVVGAAIAIAASGLALVDSAATLPIWIIAEVCLFTTALRTRRLTAVIVAAVHACLLYVAAVVIMDRPPTDPGVLILPAWTIAVVAAGAALRANHDYVAALKRTAHAVVVQRDADIARHIGEERLRIARDLHDSVAHTVSIVSIHTGAAERQLDRDLTRARESLQEARVAARSVTDELQSILVVLRSVGGKEDPEALVGGIGDLIATARRAGLTIDAAVAAIDDVEPSVGLAAYRIVQESLTNALRHGAGSARIDVERSPRTLRLTIENPMRESAEDALTGFGIVGMTERALSAGGSLRAGRAGQRFIVRADLPLASRTRAEASERNRRPTSPAENSGGDS